MKKCVVLGISGGIAVFKIAQLTSDLIKKGYDVEVIMSENATRFVAPLTFESLTNHNVYVDTFAPILNRSISHISLAKKCDVFVLVPATANVIAKVAHGIADDMLTTTFLTINKPKIIAPAMNTQMYENPVNLKNIETCKQFGYKIVDCDEGFLACGDNGKGRLAPLTTIMEHIDALCADNPFLKGKKILVSAGPTQEKMDPVRFISNHSTGKMGYAIAQSAYDHGANVTLISGPVQLADIDGIKHIKCDSAQEMFNEMVLVANDYDFIIQAAAISDFRFKKTYDQKFKKDDDEEINVSLIKNPDILKHLCEHKKEHQIICGFSMESENLLTNAKAKLISKKCDLIVANNICDQGAGFANDTNIVHLIDKNTNTKIDLTSKYEIGTTILEKMNSMFEKGDN